MDHSSILDELRLRISLGFPVWRAQNVVLGNFFLDAQRSAAWRTTLACNSAANARNKIRTDEWFRRIRDYTDSNKRPAQSSWGLHQNCRLVSHLATFMRNGTARRNAAAMPMT